MQGHQKDSSRPARVKVRVIVLLWPEAGGRVVEDAVLRFCLVPGTGESKLGRQLEMSRNLSKDEDRVEYQ